MDRLTEKARAHVRVYGRVQGVNFRWTTRDQAAELGVTGWVRNLPDGSVELVAEGNRERVDMLVEWCRKGPALAWVDDLSIRWKEATGEFSDFSVRY